VEPSPKNPVFMTFGWLNRHYIAHPYFNIVGRRLLLLGLDGILIVIAFYGAIALRLNNPVDIGIFLTKQKALLPAAIFSGLGVL